MRGTIAVSIPRDEWYCIWAEIAPRKHWFIAVADARRGIDLALW